MAKKEKRFLVETVKSDAFGIGTYILVDKKTGVNYLFACSGYAGGMTPLLNRDGTPIVTPVPPEYDD